MLLLYAPTLSSYAPPLPAWSPPPLLPSYAMLLDYAPTLLLLLYAPTLPPTLLLYAPRLGFCDTPPCSYSMLLYIFLLYDPTLCSYAPSLCS
eukprot:2483741-Rhodomonas_salina.2